MLALDDLLKAADGLLQRHIFALIAGELFCDGEGLGQETLHLTGTVNGQLISFRQLVHTHDGDDILQLLITLQNGLDGTGGLVVLHAQNLGGEDSGSGVQGVNSGVNT